MRRRNRHVLVDGVWYRIHAIENGMVEYEDHHHPCYNCDMGDNTGYAACGECGVIGGYLGYIEKVPLQGAEIKEAD